MAPLTVTTIPTDFRAYGVFNFSELPKIIYSIPNIQYCAMDEILANKDNLRDFFQNKFGEYPRSLVMYEELYGDNIREAIHVNYFGNVVFITEDLNLRSLTTLWRACEASTVVLPRFNIINDLVGETRAKIVGFPLHCSEDMVADPVEHSEFSLVDFGQLKWPPNNVYSDRMDPEANHYQYRQEWKDRFEAAIPGRYNHIRVEKERLKDEIRKHSAGFACTYFPYNFLQKCRDEQGPDWALHNTPKKFHRSYLVAKFFEVPGAGLLLLGDPTYVEDFLAESGFVDRENFIAIRPETHKEVLEYLVDPANIDAIATIRRNGNELAKARHRIQNRIELYQGVMADLNGA